MGRSVHAGTERAVLAVDAVSRIGASRYGTLVLIGPGQRTDDAGTGYGRTAARHYVDSLKSSVVEAAALESSTLQTGLVDCLDADTAAFANLGNDHLDIHRDSNAYFAAKPASPDVDMSLQPLPGDAWFVGHTCVQRWRALPWSYLQLWAEQRVTVDGFAAEGLDCCAFPVHARRADARWSRCTSRGGDDGHRPVVTAPRSGTSRRQVSALPGLAEDMVTRADAALVAVPDLDALSNR